MNSGTPRRRRARPVADAPVDELLARTDQLAKGWLLALLENVALEDAATVLAGSLAADGPRICAAALRAIADDRDLRRLEPGGVLEPLASACGEFAGASGPAAALRTVDALHAVLWSALRSEMRDPDVELVSELAQRLDAVCELIRAAAVVRQGDAGPAAPPPFVAPEPVASPTASADPGRRFFGPAEPEVERAFEPVPVPGPEPESEPEFEFEPELEPAFEPAFEPEPAPAREPEIPRPTQLRVAHPTVGRRERADALWVAALDEEVTRSRRGGGALSLLLVELEDGERIAASESGPDASAAFGRFAQAVRGVLRRQDLLASEDQTRVWVIARDTSRPGARALAERISQAVGEADPLRGAPMRVGVGLAVLGEDAHDCATLLDAAEEAALAAAAGGDRVAEYVPGDAPDRDEP